MRLLSKEGQEFFALEREAKERKAAFECLEFANKNPTCLYSDISKALGYDIGTLASIFVSRLNYDEEQNLFFLRDHLARKVDYYGVVSKQKGDPDA